MFRACTSLVSKLANANCRLQFVYIQRCAPALFCAFALASVKPKKERKSEKKTEREKSESAERER